MAFEADRISFLRRKGFCKIHQAADAPPTSPTDVIRRWSVATFTTEVCCWRLGITAEAMQAVLVTYEFVVMTL
jgi:hypothetical protein